LEFPDFDKKERIHRKTVDGERRNTIVLLKEKSMLQGMSIPNKCQVELGSDAYSSVFVEQEA
jgi:hypothetical protein